MHSRRKYTPVRKIKCITPVHMRCDSETESPKILSLDSASVDTLVMTADSEVHAYVFPRRSIQSSTSSWHTSLMVCCSHLGAHHPTLTIASHGTVSSTSEYTMRSRLL